MIDSKVATNIFDLVGGEPMEPNVWPQVKKIVDIALGRGITPWLFTNGMYMTSEDARWLVKKGAFVTMKLNIGNSNDSKELEMQAKMIGKDIKEGIDIKNIKATTISR